LPNVEAISGGKLHVPHFTNKAKIEKIVADARFEHHTFVIAPFFYQNLLGVMAPQKAPDGASGWAMPLNPEKRVIHAGDINELGPLVVGAFARPQLAGNGECLPLVGDFLSFNDIIATLNAQEARSPSSNLAMRCSMRERWIGPAQIQSFTSWMSASLVPNPALYPLNKPLPFR
jgi:hypothetical protein